MAKDQMSSPFHNAMVNNISEKGDAKNIFDKNPNPYFSKPHDCGPDTIPVVMKSDLDGLGGSGISISGNAAVSSTMGGGVAKKS